MKRVVRQATAHVSALRFRGDARLDDGVRDRRDGGARKARTLERRCLEPRLRWSQRWRQWARRFGRCRRRKRWKQRERGQRGQLRRGERRGRWSRREGRIERGRERQLVEWWLERQRGDELERRERRRVRWQRRERRKPGRCLFARRELLQRRLEMPVYDAVRIRRRVRGRRQVRRQHSLRGRRLLRLNSNALRDPQRGTSREAILRSPRDSARVGHSAG